MTTSQPQAQASAPSTPEEAAAAQQQQQIARLKNEKLLVLMNETASLYSDLDNTCLLLMLSEEQKPTRAAMLKEVKALKTALEREYGSRVLRGYQSQYKKLQATLQPQPQQSADQEGGRRLIPIRPIRAGADDPQEGEQPDALQVVVTEFTEQLRAILAPTPAPEPAPESASTGEKAQDHQEPTRL